MTPQALEYLRTRLASIECDECAEAAQRVSEAIPTARHGLSIRAERDLCYTIWGYLSRALDIADLSEADALQLDALEAEMAGRVLTARIATGEMVKAA